MSKREFSLVRWVPIRPGISLLLSLSVLLFLIFQGLKSQQVNNVDNFYVDDQDNRYFQQFKKDFPKNEFFVVTFKDTNLFSHKNLLLIKDLTNKISKLESVIDVQSLANVDFTVGDQDSFSVRKFLDKIPSTEAELAQLKLDALSEPLYMPGLLSRDGTAASIIVFVKEIKNDDNYRRKLLDKVNLILKPYQEQGWIFYKAGWTITNFTLSEVLNRDLQVFMPICYIFIAIAIYLIFRKLTLVFLALTNLTACLLSIVGLFGLTGISINNLTSVAFTLGVTLSLADTVHIFSHLDIQLIKRFSNHREALSFLLGKLVRPCFFTSLTTAIGFASLGMTQIHSMREFAIIASLSMFFEFFYSFFMLPALLAYINPTRTFSNMDYDSGDNFTRLLTSFYARIKRNASLLLSICVLIALTSLWLLTQVPVETNVTNYFRKSSQLRQDLSAIEHEVGGISSFDVSLNATQEEQFKEPASLKYIDQLTTFIRNIPGVDSANAASDLFKEMNKSFHAEDSNFYLIPETRNQIEQFLLIYDGSDLFDFIKTDFKHTRISVRMSLHSTREYKVVLEQVKKYISENPAPQGISSKLTGTAPNFVNVSHEMVDSQIGSFATALIIICIMMSLALRSFKFGLLSLVPNVFPVLLTFGIMGLFGIALDTGTIMIASVTLGITCDDTVHFLFDLKSGLSKGLTVEESLQQAFMHKGRAIVSTSLILTIGLMVLGVANFVPIANFGLLCAITMLSGVIGELLFFPSLLLVTSRIDFFNKFIRGTKA
jgi:uncharacterized protein